MHNHVEIDRGRGGYWRRRVTQLCELLGMMLLLAFVVSAARVSQTARALVPSNLYIMNDGFGPIVRYDGISGAFRNIVAESQPVYPPPDSPLSDAISLAVDPNNIVYIGDANQRILRYDGITGTFIDIFTDLPSEPSSLIFGPDGALYVAVEDEVRRYDAQSRALLGSIAISGFASAMDFGPDGRLYVNTGEILRYDVQTGRSLGVFIPSGSGGLRFPRYLTFGPDGNLYIINYPNNQVLRYSGKTGAFIDIFVGVASAYPSPDDPRIPSAGGLAFGPDGNLYISSNSSNDVRRYSGRTGALIDIFISGGQLYRPGQITFSGVATALPSDPESEPAQVTVVQRPAIDQPAERGTITNTILSVNRGKGAASNTTITLPFDPTKVAVLDAQFSRPGAWVSRLDSNSIEIQTGRLGSRGDIVTATVRLQLLPGVAPDTALTQPLTYRWSDGQSGGSGRSNTPIVAEPQHLFTLSTEMASAPAGSTRVFRCGIFAPGEPISLWYNTPDGRAVAVGQFEADQNGAISVELATAGLPQGSYSMVAFGSWTEATVVGIFEVT